MPPLRTARIVPHPPRRSFFSLPFATPTRPSSPPPAGTLTRQGSAYVYQERRVMDYSPRELYAIIADVDSYQSFLPFATASTVLSAQAASVKGKEKEQPVHERGWLRDGNAGDHWALEAELRVGAMGFEEGYVSHVDAVKWQSVAATAKDSSIFKHLLTRWTLAPFPPSSPSPAAPHDASRTTVDLYLAYAFASPFHAAAVSAVWEKVSGLMVDGFEKRARQVYPR